MIIIGIIINFILTALSDWYMWRNVLKFRAAKRVYIAVNAVIYILVLVSMICFKAVGSDAELFMYWFMWVVWLFVIVAAPKYTFVVFSIAGDLLRKILGVKAIWLSAIGMLCALGVFCVMLYGTFVGRTDIEVRKIEIVDSRIPEAFDGYRIVQFSDLHLETIIGRERFVKRVVETMNGLSPDLVINSGDIVNRSYKELNDKVMAQLSAVESVDGVYSVFGNHDLGFYISDTIATPREYSINAIRERLQGIGWQWLEDSTTVIRRGGDSISLTGMTFPESYRGRGHVHMTDGTFADHVYDSSVVNTYNVTVSHAPQFWTDILDREHGAQLTLSGHVHAMQLKMAGFSPAQLLYDKWSGLYEERGRKLYINDGLGCVMFPMRVGVRPEITLIELRSKR